MADKIKTLSQAIRLGATFHPQCFYSFHQYDPYDSSKIEGTCALGAASDAVGIEPNRLRKRFPEVSGNIFYDIIRMNDTEKKTREQIATWLEEQGL